MGKMIGILVIVLGVWVGLEVYTEGTQNAFGGRLASIAGSDSEAAGGEAPRERIRSSVQRNHEETDARRDRMLGD